MQQVQTVSSLNSQQKEAVGLLSIGTFLEYFDLMLYVHMAVLLNTLFFPQTDPFTASLLTAFAFSSTYILRPFGALVFGYIGDKIGRKFTVVFTTLMMSFSCLVMANLPTYAQIGITASWIITICRMAQGLSTMGEVIGANIYIMEIIRPPVQYAAVALIAVIAALGGTAALGVASLVTTQGFNWRLAFWVGAGVAIVGSIARTRLRETKDFADAKLRVKKILEKANQDHEKLKTNPIWNEKINKKTALCLFLIECSWPVCFYFSYIYCGNVLKNDFNLSPEQVIQQNFIVSTIQLIGWTIIIFLSYKIYPLKILKVKLVIFLTFILFVPLSIENATSPFTILLVQSFIVTFGFIGMPAIPIFYKHLPIFKRFTCATFAYALSRAFIYVVTSFGFVYAADYFGHMGILVIIIPTAIAFTYGLRHFDSIEKAKPDHYYSALNQKMKAS